MVKIGNFSLISNFQWPLYFVQLLHKCVQTSFENNFSCCPFAIIPRQFQSSFYSTYWHLLLKRIVVVCINFLGRNLHHPSFISRVKLLTKNFQVLVFKNLLFEDFNLENFFFGNFDFKNFMFEHFDFKNFIFEHFDFENFFYDNFDFKTLFSKTSISSTLIFWT